MLSWDRSWSFCKAESNHFFPISSGARDRQGISRNNTPIAGTDIRARQERLDSGAAMQKLAAMRQRLSGV
jgi:hypothetical protein